MVWCSCGGKMKQLLTIDQRCNTELLRCWKSLMTDWVVWSDTVDCTRSHWMFSPISCHLVRSTMDSSNLRYATDRCLSNASLCFSLCVFSPYQQHDDGGPNATPQQSNVDSAKLEDLSSNVQAGLQRLEKYMERQVAKDAHTTSVSGEWQEALHAHRVKLEIGRH